MICLDELSGAIAVVIEVGEVAPHHRQVMGHNAESSPCGPPSLFPHKMQPEPPTLYHRIAAAADLVLLPECGAHANVQRISQWAHAIPTAEFQELTVPTAGVDNHAIDPAPFVTDVLRTMRRDIRMRSKIYGLTHVLLGLVIPVQVYEVETSSAATTIKFLARGTPDAPLRMCVEFKGATMDAREVDMLHMLSPALATHLVDATRAPRVPAAMLEIARSVPYKNANRASDSIDVIMARARRALMSTGFRAPRMDAVSVWMDNMSLEDWLQRTMMSLDGLLVLDRQISDRLESLATCKRQMDGDIDALRGLCNNYRAKLARCMALGADALP